MVKFNVFSSRNFMLRAMSAAILAPLVLGIVYLGGILYTLTVMILAVLMAYEWYAMISTQEKNKLMWQVIGLFYIALPCTSMIWLREHPKGMVVIYWLLSVVWVTDIMAYLFGSIIGGWKIAPKISPNKTWAGLIGAILGAFMVGAATAVAINASHPQYVIVLSTVLGIYAQIGDLIESWIKRLFAVKDSGNIIPGHGGVLDRVDSLVPVAPKVVMVLMFDHWGIF
jgi:phosphatidate cytidylyltransferase